jgi:O-antigen ligase
MVRPVRPLPTGRSGTRPAAAGTLPDLRWGPGDVRPEEAQPSRVVLGIVAASIALAALVNPKLPGHSGPVDATIVVAVFAVFLWALRVKAIVRLPFAVPMTGIMITGLVAGIFSAYPSDSVRAIVQEIFLFLWCAALATVCRTPRALSVLLRTWAISATAWAVVLLLAVAGHLTKLSGAGSTANGRTPAGGFGNRARLLFDHPNMAGNFFMVAVFILVASGYPRRLWVRAVMGLVLVAAMFVTGSNAALLSLVGGSAITAFLHIRARAGMIKATAVAAGLAVVLGIGFVTVAQPLISYAQQSNNALLQASVARGAKSATARESLFAWQFKLYERGDLIGIGPNGTQEALGAEAAPAVKEAHNDYLGTLVERGPLGLLALFVLIGVVFSRLVAFTRRPLPPRLAAAVPVPAALAGACAAFAMTAFTHETLHYRWLFTLLGIVAAVHLLARRESGEEPVGMAARGPAGAPLRAPAARTEVRML